MRSLRRVLHKELILLLGAVLMLVVGLSWVGMARLARSQADERVVAELGHLERELASDIHRVEQTAGVIAQGWASGRLDPLKDQATYDQLLPLVDGAPLLTGFNLVQPDGSGFGMGRLASGWGARSIHAVADGWTSGPIVGDPAGSVRMDPHVAARIMDYRTRPWFTFGATRTTPAWMEPYPFVGRLAGQHGLAYVVPVRNREGAFLGVLAIDVLLEEFTTALRTTQPSPGSVVTILDREGRILVPPTSGRFADPVLRREVTLRPVTEAQFPLIWRLHENHRQGRDRGESLDRASGPWSGRLRSFAPSEGIAWELILAQPDQDILSAPNRRALVVAGLALVLLVGLAWQAWRISSRFTTPLDDLAATAEGLGRHEAPPPPPSEFEELHALGEALANAHRALRDREALQDQLRQSQKLETLGTLAGGIAHDVNNQLTAILGQIGLSMEHLPEDHPAHRNLHAAEDATNRCAETTRALLAFSRPSQSELVSLDLNAVMREGLVLLSRVLDKRVTLITDFTEDLPHVLGDQVQVEQILVNLVVNARDSLPAGGTIQVGTGRHEDGLAFWVRDNGVGMTPEVQARIFEPFYTTKELGKGTGLGLSMVLGLVQAHGGRIEVQSQWGLGSTFLVHLQRADAPLAEPSAITAPVPRQLKGRRILVVEDEHSIRDLVEEALRIHGAEVVLAGNGLEGWQAFLETPFDLVFSDQLMPQRTGLEMLALIRGIAPKVPVILASGRGLEGLESELQKDPHLSLLPKPFTLHRLFQVVEESLGN
ncbi:MAG TPA: ATP-binding protein [Holophagaceae bacterium]|nr:ATP-binding protein [Holophagaceae bacterium]